ncbi:MAG: hypothetical protein K1060chlam2_01344 [Chlamydiae bacterium]|nr:hypothetical protein [Chlamydiota bacterium]
MNKLIKLLCIIFIVTVQGIFAGEEGRIICIHGFMRTHRNMSRIEGAFQKEGREVINWEYASRSKTIEEHGADLVMMLQEAAAERPEEPIHFITHSLGGIIVRAALNHPDCPMEAKIGKAVLIAPPNQGSIFARKCKRFPLFRRMMGEYAGLELMNTPNFEDIGQFPSSKEVLIIAGKLGFNPFIEGRNDGKVAVEETLLTTPHNHHIVSAGHSWICYSSEVIRLAKAFFLPRTSYEAAASGCQATSKYIVKFETSGSKIGESLQKVNP